MITASIMKGLILIDWEISLFHYKVYKILLTHFSPVSHFYTFWKYQKTIGFLTFSRGYRNVTLDQNGLKTTLLTMENFIELNLYYEVWSFLQIREKLLEKASTWPNFPKCFYHPEMMFFLNVFMKVYDIDWSNDRESV